MSNYNMTLQSNNADLQAILNTINELPEAVEQATPEISVGSNGLITATAGDKSSTYQLAFQAAKTITPTTDNQVAVFSGYYTGGNIMVTGDSNLVAGNIKKGVSIFGVNGNLEEGGGSSGSTETEDAFITRALSSYTNDRVTSIGSYAFAYCSYLTSVNFPVATNIGEGAFYNCERLKYPSLPLVTKIGSSAFKYLSYLSSVNFPAATTIGAFAFADCDSLANVSFPNVASIGQGAFSGCSALSSVNFPAVTGLDEGSMQSCTGIITATFPIATMIKPFAFSGCAKLVSVDMPMATTIGSSAFYYCKSLSSVSFPSVTHINKSAFYGCSNLTTAIFPIATDIGVGAFSGCSKLGSVSFPAATTIYSSAFYYCRSLTTASFPKVAAIQNGAFYACYMLESIYLLGSSVCNLSTSAAFYQTPIADSSYTGTYGSIYVPTSLLTSYQTATNWTYYSSRFVGI